MVEKIRKTSGYNDKRARVNESFEKDRIYDELSLTLTDYEEGIDDANDLYDMLVKIQNNWEMITAQE